MDRWTGSLASSLHCKRAGVGQQMIANVLNRPATIKSRPGYEFKVMVTEDLAFPGPYQRLIMHESCTKARGGGKLW